jgi:hypothetical protein
MQDANEKTRARSDRDYMDYDVRFMNLRRRIDYNFLSLSRS